MEREDESRSTNTIVCLVDGRRQCSCRERMDKSKTQPKSGTGIVSAVLSCQLVP